MTSKERGLAPFRGERADRFPMWYGGDPETTQNLIDFLGAKDEDDALYNILGIDYKTVRPRYIGPELKTYADGTVDTVWGIRRGGYFYGQPLNHPLKGVETLEELDKYTFPDPKQWDARFTDEDKRWLEGYCAIGGTWAPFFHDAIELMDMEEFMIAMYECPEVPDAVVERSFEFYLDQMRRAFADNKGSIDMMFVGNDFGSQRALLCSPTHWRKLFKPHLRKLCDLAHKNGIVTALHSCGDIHDIIGDLIEIGFDAINPIQVFAEHMDPVELHKQWGGKMVFFGGIDENIILRTGTPQEVRDETRRIIDIFGKDGRYIVAPSHDYLLPEIPAANIVAMYDEAKHCC